MDTISFMTHEDLAEYMYDHAIDGKTVYAVLFYEDARRLLKELCYFDDTELCDLEISEPMYKGYSKEFYVVLTKDLTISIEEAFHEANEHHKECYYFFGGDDTIALIDSDADSRVIKAALGSKCYEITIDVDADTDDDDDYCDGDCEKCEDFWDFVEFVKEHF